MPEYRYVALDSGGRESNGSISAGSRQEAMAKLESGGLFALELGESAAISLNQQIGGKGKKASRREIVIFTRQLGDLLRAGLPIDRALLILEEQAETPAMRQATAALKGDVQSGKSLSEAMESLKGVFPVMVPRMVRAGEASGQLESVLDSVGKYLEADMQRRSQVNSALMYPCLLLGVSIVAVLFITTFLIPRLTGLFEDMGQALPLPTVMLLAVSSAVIQYWYVIVGGLVAAIVGFTAWKRSRAGALAWDRILLSMPIVGLIIKSLCMARFARMLGTLHAGGVTILEALELVSSAMGNKVYENALSQVREGVREGEMVGARLADTGVFTPMAVHMVTVGEESGNLEGLLTRLADIYDFDADNRLKRAMSMLEPTIILVMGIFIAFIIVAVLLPIFDLNASMNVN